LAAKGNRLESHRLGSTARGRRRSRRRYCAHHPLDSPTHQGVRLGRLPGLASALASRSSGLSPLPPGPRWGCALIAFSDFSPITSATGAFVIFLGLAITPAILAWHLITHAFRRRNLARERTSSRQGFTPLLPRARPCAAPVRVRAACVLGSDVPKKPAKILGSGSASLHEVRQAARDEAGYRARLARRLVTEVMESWATGRPPGQSPSGPVLHPGHRRIEEPSAARSEGGSGAPRRG